MNHVFPRAVLFPRRFIDPSHFNVTIVDGGLTMEIQTETVFTAEFFLAESEVSEQGPEAVIHIMPHTREEILEWALD